MENVPRENIDPLGDHHTDNNKESKAENEASLLEKPPTAALPHTITDKCSNDKAGRRMDGGLRAWLIVLSSFMCNGLIFGVINSYSLVYVELQKILEANGVQEAGGKAGKLTVWIA